jgi:hypothetical protein
MPPVIDLVGRRFGRLIVLSIAPKTTRMLKWNVRCDCGSERVVYGCHLKAGNTVSCGCKAASQKTRLRHGHWSGRRPTPEHATWAAMIQRCTNPKAPHYERYGGRGIAVCERWLVFENFFADMGKRPSPKHSIDRKDNDGNYEPDNCRWATKLEQMRNTSVTRYLTHNGQTRPIGDWADEVGIAVRAIAKRLRRGWSIADALSKPLRVTCLSKRSAA